MYIEQIYLTYKSHNCIIDIQIVYSVLYIPQCYGHSNLKQTKLIHVHIAIRLTNSMLYMYIFQTTLPKYIILTCYIPPPQLGIKETTGTSTSASYLDLLLSVTDRTLSTKLYDKCDDFDFRIVKFPCICSNIPDSQAYGVYISQLVKPLSQYGGALTAIPRKWKRRGDAVTTQYDRRQRHVGAP